MKLLRKSKLNFLFFSVIFLFLSSCSVESNLPDKISKDIGDQQKIDPPPKQEQPSQPSNPGQNPSTPGQNPSTPGQNPSNPGTNTETQIDKGKTQEEEKRNPGISQKPDLPPAVIQNPDVIEEKPGIIKITDDKKGLEQPKIPSFTPQKPSDEEEIVPEPFDPKKEEKETDVQLAQLKGYLSTLPSSFRITNHMQSSYPLTIITEGKTIKKNFSYVNFIDPIQDLNDKYSVKLDFSNAVVASTGPSNQEKPINNVLLFLHLKDNDSIKSSKMVSLFYKQEETSKINLIAKKLPDDFKNIFPSFLAFSLLNSNNDVISNPFFNQIGHVLNNRNFGVGLKDTFAEFSPEINDNEKEKYGFDVISTQPDDENGKLRLNLQIWKIDQNTEIKRFLPNNKSLEFSGLAKNSDNIYQFELSKKDLEIAALKNDVKKTLLERDLKSNFSKHTFLKHLLEHLYIRVNAEINNKWIKLSEVKHNRWLIFPQIQFANLVTTQLIDNLTLEKNDKKITWNLDLKTVLLNNNQILTPNGEFLLGKEKIHKISGVLEIN